ncbi:hypothetical protein K437DRAFT_296256 [Tilletiaria anomala UBC 951]|uniref:Uncharacterized protein n=1 Tax=Tilletiaria anomala (strain ATCC 24038 / CBS 436.72 / UBC 951) TaxID=1037660 RepID=A0A066VEQ0_TILAU|nr:uncharacterized protein K437DRAFT_296256 [Tilletiaria anomala UBC 951]KDN38778.1 hypothetical protein K437DRAFT_296256 [Tilletiaria anomala UBC 951]
MLRRGSRQATHLAFRDAVFAVLGTPSGGGSLEHRRRLSHAHAGSSWPVLDIPGLSLQQLVTQSLASHSHYHPETELLGARGQLARNQFPSLDFVPFRPPPPPCSDQPAKAKPNIGVSDMVQADMASQSNPIGLFPTKHPLPRLEQATQALLAHGDIVAAMSICARDVERLLLVRRRMHAQGVTLDNLVSAGHLSSLDTALDDLVAFLQQLVDQLSPTQTRSARSPFDDLTSLQQRFIRRWRPNQLSQEAVMSLSKEALVLFAASEVFDSFGVLGRRPPPKAASTMLSLFTEHFDRMALGAAADVMLTIYATDKTSKGQWESPAWRELMQQLALALGKAGKPEKAEQLFAERSDNYEGEPKRGDEEDAVADTDEESVLFRPRPGAAPTASKLRGDLANDPRIWATLIECRVEAGNLAHAEIWLQRYREYVAQADAATYADAAKPFVAMMRGAVRTKPNFIRKSPEFSAFSSEWRAAGFSDINIVRAYSVRAIKNMMQADEISLDIPALNLLVAFEASNAQIYAVADLLLQLGATLQMRNGIVHLQTYECLFRAQFSLVMHGLGRRVDAASVKQMWQRLEHAHIDMLASPSRLFQHLRSNRRLLLGKTGEKRGPSTNKLLVKLLNAAIKVLLAVGDDKGATEALEMFTEYDLEHDTVSCKNVFLGLLNLAQRQSGDKGSPQRLAKQLQSASVSHNSNAQSAPTIADLVDWVRQGM